MGGVQPLQESDLIFSSAASSLRYTLGELKRSNLSITNRLHSIKQDATFVAEVANAYGLPLVSNERCGSWYMPPGDKAGSAYFKSTDGHFGHWAFSLRRLNLQVIEVLAEHGGCIIVDSTRRGKSMPDALSKTVPIWTAVLNGLLFPRDDVASLLQTPSDVVSASEHSQIEARLRDFIASAQSLNLGLDELRKKLQKLPVQLAWVRPGDVLPSALPHSPKSNLIVLCTASSRDSHGQALSTYVQGAADDSESWAHGLDAATFWAHHEELLSSSEDDLPQLIEALLSTRLSHVPSQPPVLIRPTINLWLGSTSTLDNASDMSIKFDLLLICAPQQPRLNVEQSRHAIHLVCTTGKLGSRQLRTELSKLDGLGATLESHYNILVVCETGKDISVGASLAVLCRYYKQDGALSPKAEEHQPMLNKTIIKQKLSWIMVSVPDAKPSRATLQSVNAYLMA